MHLHTPQLRLASYLAATVGAAAAAAVALHVRHWSTATQGRFNHLFSLLLNHTRVSAKSRSFLLIITHFTLYSIVSYLVR
jgi:hypothetical protein